MADITALAAKAGDFRQTKLISGKTRIQTTGTVGTLVLGGDSYTNCSIDGGVHVKEVEGSGGLIWKYTVKFVRDTSA
jgi:hypothetical protein